MSMHGLLQHLLHQVSLVAFTFLDNYWLTINHVSFFQLLYEKTESKQETIH